VVLPGEGAGAALRRALFIMVRESARPLRANAGNGGRFDGVLCCAYVVDPRWTFQG
jgi:hypothetical protein